MTPSTSVKGTLWHSQAHMPSVQSSSLTIVSGEGAYVTTADGQRLLDGTAGLWHANVGHGRESIARAAYDQMCRLETYHCFGRFNNEPAVALADRVSAMSPVRGSKVFWTSGGSDAVDLACKLARRHWQLEGRPGKRIILSRNGGYHGLHGFGTSIAGLDFNREGYGSASLVPETARIPTHDAAAAAAVVQELGADSIAAIVVEPIAGTGGVLLPEPGYLQSLQRLARDNDILFVVDEVITGFGRTGEMFASSRFGLTPDMLLMAKGITSGYAPLGGVLVAPRVSDRFYVGEDAPVFRHGITYSGHATACAVAGANLDVLEEEHLVERAGVLEGVLHQVLQPLAASPYVTEVRSGIGFIAGIQLQPDVPGAAVADVCLERGVITRVITDNTLQICPPFVVTDEECAQIADAVAGALQALDGVPSWSTSGR